MPRPVTVQYYKYPDRPHWRYGLHTLGEDAHGVWLGGPSGTTVQRGDETPIEMRHPFVQLIPRDRWWTLIANLGGDLPIYIDITTPARWTAEDHVEMVDLDLDVVRRSDGKVEVLDEDEFNEHRATLSYPQWMVDRARATTAQIVIELEADTEPFGQTPEQWLAKLGDR